MPLPLSSYLNADTPAMNTLKDIPNLAADATAGSVAGTVGMPADIYHTFFGGDPKGIGTSEWFGKLLGGDTSSPSFKIANMTAMAPPMVGAAKWANTASKGAETVMAHPDLIRRGYLTLVNQANAFKEIGKMEEANKLLQHAAELQKYLPK